MALTQKLINDGNHAVDEMLAGVLAAHPQHLKLAAPRAVVAKLWPAPRQSGSGDRWRVGA